jgi:hypothetical protein
MKALKCVLASVTLSSVLAMPVFAAESFIQARVRYTARKRTPSTFGGSTPRNARCKEGTRKCTQQFRRFSSFPNSVSQPLS